MYEDKASASPSIAAAPQRTEPRQIEHLLDYQEKQVSFMCSTMRRVEELADRIGGAVPTAGETNGKDQGFPDGTLGALHRQNADRDGIISRISEAMDRIERMI
jgi:hypothetical protein